MNFTAESTNSKIMPATPTDRILTPARAKAANTVVANLTPIEKIRELLATKELFIFDLDGTLFNTLGDLAPAVNYALKQFGVREISKENVRSCIGNGSKNLIRRSVASGIMFAAGKTAGEPIADKSCNADKNRDAGKNRNADISSDASKGCNAKMSSAEGTMSRNLDCREIEHLDVRDNDAVAAVLESEGFDDAKIDEVHKVYSAYYWEHCTKNTKPYEGVVEFLKRINATDSICDACKKRAAMLTNKPVNPAKKILEKFGLIGDSENCGATAEGNRGAIATDADKSRPAAESRDAIAADADKSRPAAESRDAIATDADKSRPANLSDDIAENSSETTSKNSPADKSRPAAESCDAIAADADKSRPAAESCDAIAADADKSRPAAESRDATATDTDKSRPAAESRDAIATDADKSRPAAESRGAIATDADKSRPANLSDDIAENSSETTSKNSPADKSRPAAESCGAIATDADKSRPANLSDDIAENSSETTSKNSPADLISAYLCGDTTPERKPSPAGIFALLQQTGVAPEKAVMIGDDMPDVLAAKNAGIDCITLLEGFGRPENLLPMEPKWTAGHIKDFAELFTPPKDTFQQR